MRTLGTKTVPMQRTNLGIETAKLFMVVHNNYERTPTAWNYSKASYCSKASSAKHPKTTAGPPPM